MYVWIKASKAFDCPEPYIMGPTWFMHMISILTQAWLPSFKIRELKLFTSLSLKWLNQTFDLCDDKVMI